MTAQAHALIYTAPRTPGATETAEWNTFCHSHDPFVVIDHSTYRTISRWRSVPRKRQFRVTEYYRCRVGLASHEVGFYATLALAEKAATEFVQS